MKITTTIKTTCTIWYVNIYIFNMQIFIRTENMIGIVIRKKMCIVIYKLQMILYYAYFLSEILLDWSPFAREN